MAGKVAAGIGLVRECIAEAGTVVDVGGSIRTPGERHVSANVERVALIMVERAQARVRITKVRGEIRQPSGDGAAAVGDLIGVSEMKLCAVGDARRPQREFPAADQGLLNGER